ncbi:MAG: helix-turn-helix domain-containing protein [Candidatus Ratteibacteria bacterium]|nr:helix-turn-helix domain-containing protein [Candidatus Ratteibacteria bacterium]
MVEFPCRFVGKFIPFPRQEEKGIAYRIEEYEKWGNVSKVCRYYNISRKTFYKWYRWYELFGIRGLGDKRAGPRKKRQLKI